MNVVNVFLSFLIFFVLNQLLKIKKLVDNFSNPFECDEASLLITVKKPNMVEIITTLLLFFMRNDYVKYINLLITTVFFFDYYKYAFNNKIKQYEILEIVFFLVTQMYFVLCDYKIFNVLNYFVFSCLEISRHNIEE